MPCLRIVIFGHTNTRVSMALQRDIPCLIIKPTWKIQKKKKLLSLFDWAVPAVGVSYYRFWDDVVWRSQMLHRRGPGHPDNLRLDLINTTTLAWYQHNIKLFFHGNNNTALGPFPHHPQNPPHKKEELRVLKILCWYYKTGLWCFAVWKKLIAFNIYSLL